MLVRLRTASLSATQRASLRKVAKVIELFGADPGHY